MSTQSIQEFETCLHATRQKVLDMDVEIGIYEARGLEDLSLQELREAYIDHATTLERTITAEAKERAQNEYLALRKRVYEAETEMVACESKLIDFEGERSTQCWERSEAAEGRWWKALDAISEYNRNSSN
jgi:hypothetical protein